MQFEYAVGKKVAEDLYEYVQPSLSNVEWFKTEHKAELLLQSCLKGTQAKIDELKNKLSADSYEDFIWTAEDGTTYLYPAEFYRAWDTELLKQSMSDEYVIICREVIARDQSCRSKGYYDDVLCGPIYLNTDKTKKVNLCWPVRLDEKPQFSNLWKQYIIKN